MTINYTTTADDFEPSARDYAGTAYVNLQNVSKTTDPYVRNERLQVARADLEAAGETLSADLVEECLSGHAYPGYIVPVIVAYLKKKYDFR